MNAQSVIEQAIAEFGPSLAVLTSFQREGVIVTDLVLRAAPNTPVLTIDTGRLPRATFHMIDQIEQRYGIHIERILPDTGEVETMVDAHGRDLFREGVPQRMLCCNIRKVRPLARRLTSGAYFSGLRRSQNESRADVEFFERSRTPVRISPLADWTAEDVARYTLENHLPEHPLYAAGYTSIGCDPCTRAVEPGEDERAGRWWWEDDAAKECGIHFTPDGRAQRTVDVLLSDILERTRVKHQGFTLWLTGMSGAGKSTISDALMERFRNTKAKAELLDGDAVRTNLSQGLGFSREDRDTNIRRIGFVAELLSRNGVIVVVAAISPYRQIREEVKKRIANFIEVHINCPIDVLASRDVKGLYKKALAGEVSNFTGISDPYEPPLHPDIEIRTDQEPVEQSVAKIWSELAKRGLITPE